MPISSRQKENPKLAAEMNRTVFCYNFSSQDYAHPELGGKDELAKWDNQPIILKAKEKKRMPFYLARHIATHLAKRELMKRVEYIKVMGTPKEPMISSAEVEAEMRKCITEVSEADVSAKSSVMAMIENLNDEPQTVEDESEVEVKPKKKGGRPKKMAEADFVGATV